MGERIWRWEGLEKNHLRSGKHLHSMEMTLSCTSAIGESVASTPNEGLLTDAWVRCAHPRAAEAPIVRRAERTRPGSHASGPWTPVPATYWRCPTRIAGAVDGGRQKAGGMS